MSISLQFRMNLSDVSTSELMIGHLSVLDNGDERSTYRVTSGIPGLQFKGSESRRGAGPIPRCRFVRVDNYEVHTKPTFQPQTIGVEGTFYDIDPLQVTVHDEISDVSITRTEFGIHFDHNVPGSAGCIVFRKKADYAEFENLMTGLRHSKISKIPLDVNYNLHEKTWKVVVHGDRFLTTESVNGTVFVPVRAFAERFPNSIVGFDAATGRVTLNGVTLKTINHLAGTSRAPLREVCGVLGVKFNVKNSTITVP